MEVIFQEAVQSLEGFIKGSSDQEDQNTCYSPDTVLGAGEITVTELQLPWWASDPAQADNKQKHSLMAGGGGDVQ